MKCGMIGVKNTCVEARVSESISEESVKVMNGGMLEGNVVRVSMTEYFDSLMNNMGDEEVCIYIYAIVGCH